MTMIVVVTLLSAHRWRSSNAPYGERVFTTLIEDIRNGEQLFP